MLPSSKLTATASTKMSDEVELPQSFQPKRRPSIVWEHFHVEDVGGGSKRAYCNHCNQSYALSKVVSTNRLLKHIAEGGCPGVHLNKQNNEQVQAEKQNNEIVHGDQTKKRKSSLWEHFPIEHLGGRSRKTHCNHCKKSFSFSKGSTTNSLLQHIDQGACPGVLCNHQKNEQVLGNQPNNNKQVLVEQSEPFQPMRCQSIVWEYFTLKHVGHGSRRAYCNYCEKSYSYSKRSDTFFYNCVIRHITQECCSGVIDNQQTIKQVLVDKRKKKKSIVWEHFTLVHDGGGSIQAYCNHCKISYAYCNEDRAFGCGRLLSHIAQGACGVRINQENNEQEPVEQPQSQFYMVSCNTTQADCMATYLRKRQKVQKIIDAMPGRICLTLDMLSSSISVVGYVILTAHFIDNDWNLQSKILNVIMEPHPESDIAFSNAVASCISDWNLEGKLFSVTINQPLNDASVDNLRKLLSVKKPLILTGQLLIRDCLARCLSNIAQDISTSFSVTVEKIRTSVKYVTSSDSHEDKFLELKQRLQVPSYKVLALDDQTRWNTTYDMLMAAAELKQVFLCLDTSDPDYKDIPSMEDWKQVEKLCLYLKPFFEMANILALPTTPTTNIFFNEACKRQLELSSAASSEYSFLEKAMREKFDNYWKSCCFLLAIAVVMDPRFKMKLVEFSFQKIYGEEKAVEYVQVVDEGIHVLFLEYTSLSSDFMQVDNINNRAVELEDHRGDTAVDNMHGLNDFDMYIKQTNNLHAKTELDEYLEESLLPRVHEFDVIDWWRLNKEKYPTLSKMARDILSVPVCSVAPESVFDTVKKERTIEALICTKNWTQSHTEAGLNETVKTGALI